MENPINDGKKVVKKSVIPQQHISQPAGTQKMSAKKERSESGQRLNEEIKSELQAENEIKDAFEKIR